VGRMVWYGKGWIGSAGMVSYGAIWQGRVWSGSAGMVSCDWVRSVMVM